MKTGLLVHRRRQRHCRQGSMAVAAGSEAAEPEARVEQEAARQRAVVAWVAVVALAEALAAAEAG